MSGYYGFTLVVRVFARPSVLGPYFRFQLMTGVNVSGFSPNLVCALILWSSGFVLLIGKFSQILVRAICPQYV